MTNDQNVQSPLSRLMLSLENATGLDAGVRTVAPLLSAVSSHQGVRDALRGTWLGHALHPLLVTVPIGTWASASLLDVAGTDPDGGSAQLLTAVGVLSAVPSALTGLAELAGTPRRDQRVGLVHAAANVVGLGLQTASWVARARGNRATGALASLAGMGAVGVAGYLGGHLAVSRDVGSKDRAFEQ